VARCAVWHVHLLGPVSLTGLEIGWSRGAPRGGELRVEQGQGPTPVEIYDNLYKKWKPDKFDANQWVQVAKGPGQYIIFLVKHHDGFCLYDSKLTDYRSTGPESAWKVDVMRQVADACHDAGLKLIVYYSSLTGTIPTTAPRTTPGTSSTCMDRSASS